VSRILALSITITKPLTKQENPSKTSDKNQNLSDYWDEIEDYHNQFEEEENFYL